MSNTSERQVETLAMDYLEHLLCNGQAKEFLRMYDDYTARYPNDPTGPLPDFDRCRLEVQLDQALALWKERLETPELSLAGLADLLRRYVR